MFARFAPDADEGLRRLADLTDLVIVGEPALRWPAIIAVLILPFVVRRPGAVMVTAVVVAYVVALLAAGGTVYARYTLTVLPMMMAALGVVLAHLRPAPWLGIAAAAGLSAWSGGPMQMAALREAAEQPPEVAVQVAVLRGVGAEIRPGETLVYCRARGERRLVPGAVSVYASGGQPVVDIGGRGLRTAGRDPSGAYARTGRSRRWRRSSTGSRWSGKSPATWCSRPGPALRSAGRPRPPPAAAPGGRRARRGLRAGPPVIG
jgi:hypothetical protein